MERERGLSINKGAIERAMWASKLALLCVGAISTATLFRAAVIPYVHDLALSTLPRVWASFRSWVSPFYIYLAVNFIIAAIAVSSSTFHRNANTNEKTSHKSGYSNSSLSHHSASSLLEKSSSWERFHIVQEANKYEESSPERDKEKERNEIEVSAADDDPPEDSSGGEESSMDETWMAIMESHRRLDRSVTMAAPATAVASPPRRLARADGEEESLTAAEAWARKEMRKSATFADRVSLRRDKSMSPEELNLRAEAFIKKVNDDMRLQRLESDQRFMEMVNRGL